MSSEDFILLFQDLEIFMKLDQVFKMFFYNLYMNKLKKLEKEQ